MLYASLLPESYKLSLKEGLFSSLPEKPLTQMHLTAAKGQTLSLQLLLRPEERASVLLTDAPYFSVNLERVNYRLHLKGPFPTQILDIGMLPDDENILRADPLLVTDAVELEKEEYHTFYLSIPVPEETDPGEYSVTLQLYQNHLFSDEDLVTEFAIYIHVVPYTLPSKDSFILDLWQHPTNIAHKHDVRLWSDEHFAVLENYVKALADLGQKSITLIVSDIPWTGQSCYTVPELQANLFEYSIVSVRRTLAGDLVCDFTAMDRYIALCKQYGICREIEVFGLTGVWGNEEEGFGSLIQGYKDPIRIRVYDEKTGTYQHVRTMAELDEYIRQLHDHFVSLGVVDRVRLVADEPADLNAYRKSLEHIHEVAPHFRMKSAINHAEFIAQFQDSVDALVPNLECVSHEYELIKRAMKEYPKKDFCWYLCSWPRTFNTFLRSHLLETRFLGTLTGALGLHGFLRWNFTVWPKDPRKDIRYSPFPAGDVNFVYPGANGKPLLSLRYMELMRGIEDYCLLQEAKRQGKEEVVRDVYALLCRFKALGEIYHGSEIIPPEEICSLDWEDYEKAREMLLDALSR